MILRWYTLLIFWTEISAVPQDSMAKAILRDMSQRKNDLQKKERTVVAKDVVSTVNELNFRIKSIYMEIREIQKSMQSEKQGPKSETLKKMYDDHARMYEESAQTMNRLVDSYTENRVHVTSDNTNAFEETKWKNLLIKLQAAKVLNQAFKFNHKLLHDSYSTTENIDLSHEERNFYKFLYVTGDKCDRTGPKLIDPVSLQINDNARPEILHVDMNVTSTNLEPPQKTQVQQRLMQKRQLDQQPQQVEYMDSDDSLFSTEVNQATIPTPDQHPAHSAHHEHVHIVGNTKPEVLHVDPSFTPHEPPASEDFEANRGI